VIYGYEIAKDMSTIVEDIGGYMGPVLYLLPGALVDTHAMARGETPQEEAFGLPEN
jgi:hypothetical protein